MAFGFGLPASAAEHDRVIAPLSWKNPHHRRIHFMRSAYMSSFNRFNIENLGDLTRKNDLLHSLYGTLYSILRKMNKESYPYFFSGFSNLIL